jgi:hypothetical protein
MIKSVTFRLQKVYFAIGVTSHAVSLQYFHTPALEKKPSDIVAII